MLQALFGEKAFTVCISLCYHTHLIKSLKILTCNIFLCKYLILQCGHPRLIIRCGRYKQKMDFLFKIRGSGLCSGALYSPEFTVLHFTNLKSVGWSNATFTIFSNSFTVDESVFTADSMQMPFSGFLCVLPKTSLQTWCININRLKSRRNKNILYVTHCFEYFCLTFGSLEYVLINCHLCIKVSFLKSVRKIQPVKCFTVVLNCCFSLCYTLLNIFISFHKLTNIRQHKQIKVQEE